MNRYKYLTFIFSVILIVLVLSGCFLLTKPALIKPQLLSPTNGATNVSTTATLTWKPSNVSQTTYEVFLGKSASNTAYIATTGQTSFVVNNLSYSTTYYWKVVSMANDQTATSDTWSFTTVKAPAPSKPFLSITGVSTSSVALGWTQSIGASMVTLYGSTSTVFNQYAILSGSSTSYMVNNLTPSTVYKFFVVAINPSGRATSNTVTATTLSYTPVIPVLPVIKSFGVTSVSTDTITLGFQTQNASVIYIYNPPSALLATLSGNATFYTITGLKPSTSYSYFIVGINPSGRATSNTVTAVTQSYVPTTSFPIYIGDKPVSPSLIQHLYVTLTGFSIHATFEGTSEWYTSSASGTCDLTTLVGTSTKFTNITLPASAIITQIRFEVSSATIVINGNSYPLNIPSSTIYMNMNSINALESGGVYFDFDISQSVEQTGQGYLFKPVIHSVMGNVRSSVIGQVMYNSMPVPMAVVSLSNSSTVVAETYTKPNGKFMISAVQTGNYTLTISASGLTSYSTSVTLSKGMNNIGTINLSILPPATPVLRISTPNPYLAVLTWTQSAQNASGFHVWESTSPMQAYTQIATLPGSATYYNASIRPAVNYYFMVSAYNSSGQTWSNIVATRTTLTLYIPSVQLTKVATISGKSLLVATAVVYHNVPTLKAATATIGNVSVSAISLSASPLVFNFNGNLSSLPSNSYVATVTVKDSENNTYSGTSGKIYIDNTPPTITVKLEGTYFSPQGTLLSWTYNTVSTYATNIKIYYGSTAPTLYATVTDNSLYHVSVSATYNSSKIAISNNNTDKVTFNNKITSGNTVLTLKATDAYSNTDTLSITFIATQNIAQPTLKITMPATIGISTTQTSTNATITVYATVGNTEGGNRIESVVIKNQPATRQSANVWTARVPLSAGSNTIEATATDLYGNTISTSTPIYVDNSTPTIEVTLTGGTGKTISPYTLTNNSSVTIYTNSTKVPPVNGSIIITDNSKMPVTAKATEITNVSTALKFTTTSDASEATFNATSSQRYTIKVFATDAFGHTSTYIATFTLVVDTASPTITITAPATVGSGQGFTATITTTDLQSGVNTSTLVATYYNQTLTNPTITSITNGYKFTFTNIQTQSNYTGTTFITAKVKDNAGNIQNASTPVYVDGQAPTINVNLTGGTVYYPSTSPNTLPYNSFTSGKATYYVYYKTAPTIKGTVTDNSKYHVTVKATYNSAAVTTTGNNSDQVTFSQGLSNGVTKLTVYATDAFGNSDVATLTFVATLDNTPPTVSIAATPSSYASMVWNSTNGSTLVATYTAIDNQGGSGLINGEAKFYIKTYGGTTTSFLVTEETTPKSTPLYSVLSSTSLGIVNKGSTDITLTIVATDNVGNVTKASTTWTVDIKYP
ncbi:beta strand repeat-containing protein [Athalassotoga saccharophila]|uniref:Fibronectin type-III domain-containing protein n=1 Tax=Athalassotoga saccharophila TaxID=1441386 RepID=A0A6N4TDL1_9BACT|nr:DUF4382 domain-containing protein [Athalassotoga saccharophila]BBJ29078.1 hypothetical protein ATHSA_p10031 [Athalassotoga saccharophila]